MQNRVNLIKNSTRSFKTPRLNTSKDNNFNNSVNVAYDSLNNKFAFPEPSKRSLNNHGIGKRNNKKGSLENNNGQNIKITESGHTNLKPNNMMRTIDDKNSNVDVNHLY